MKIYTNGQQMTRSLVLVALMPQKAADMAVKEFNGEVRKDPRGRALHRCDLVPMALDEDGTPVRQEKNVNVSLVVPVDVEMGRYYVLAGDVVVTHWQNDSRQMMVSIVAESLKPADMGSGSSAPAGQSAAPAGSKN